MASIQQFIDWCEIRQRRAREGAQEGDHRKVAQAFKDLKMVREIVGPAYGEVDEIIKDTFPVKERVEGVLLTRSEPGRFFPRTLSLHWCKEHDRDDLIKEEVIGSKFKAEAQLEKDEIRLAIIKAESKVIPKITVAFNGTGDEGDE